MANLQIHVSAATAATAVAVIIPAALAFFLARKRRRNNNTFLLNERGRSRTPWRRADSDSREVLEAKERFLAQLALAEGDMDSHKVQLAYEELSSLNKKERDLDEIFSTKIYSILNSDKCLILIEFRQFRNDTKKCIC